MPRRQERREKVEPYLLTPEAKSFQTKFKHVAQVRQALAGELVLKMSELKQIQEMFGQVNSGIQQLMQFAPKRKVEELAQQPNFEDISITY